MHPGRGHQRRANGGIAIALLTVSAVGLRLFALFMFAAWSAAGVTQAPDPTRFAAGKANQSGLSFSPDGHLAVWSAWDGVWGEKAGRRTIYMARYEAGRWTDPQAAPFTDAYSDDDPFISPDGTWLYFVSDRPVARGEAQTSGDIWRYSLQTTGRLERLSINSPAAEYSPIVTDSGALYFASERAGGRGQGDLYVAVPGEKGFAAPVPLGPALNSRHGEWNLWVSGDESELIFESSSRPTNRSVSGDLYISWLTSDGWTSALPIDALNTVGSDLLPRLHPDGATLYYTTATIGGHARILRTDLDALRATLKPAYAPPLLVANRSSHEVVFVDLAEGEISRRVTTGAGPHLLSNVSAGRVLATGYGVFPQPHAEPVSRRPPFIERLNARATLIDASGGEVLRDWEIGNCLRPHASWLLGNRAFVSCEDERRVLALDIDSGDVLAAFATEQAGSHVLALAPGTTVLAVANTESGSVSLIDTADGRTRVVETGGGSEGLLALEKHFWVSNVIDGTLVRIDPTTGTVDARIDDVCSAPLALDGDASRIWVACTGSSELVAVDPKALLVTQRIALTAQPLNLLLHPNGRLAYAALPRENAVAEIDLQAGLELRRIAVGIEPDGLRWGE